MKKSSFKFFWEDTLLEMLPSRALFLPETKELLICDIHLGKAEYFQQNGIPLTNNSDKNNFERIKKIVKKYKPEKLIILGDLFHSKYSIDKSLQKFFQSISNRVLNNKKVNQEERVKQKQKKIKEMEREKVEAKKRFMQQEELALKAKALELKEEKELSRQLSIDLKRFVREDQAELRREQAEKQRKFLDQIKLEKKIKSFIQREEKEVQALSKYVLSQQRESYEEVQQRIDKIKEKYKLIREQKINEAIRERVASLGIKVEETDDKATLLEKERVYNEEREKIEYALESFYRSAHSLCFQLNKKYIPKYLSIIRCIDKRFETGEIYIKWDDAIEADWLILIYIKNNSPDEGIIIEDKTDPDNHTTHEFQPNEIFKASDIMVDALTKLLDSERNKRKVS